MHVSSIGGYGRFTLPYPEIFTVSAVTSAVAAPPVFTAVAAPLQPRGTSTCSGSSVSAVLVPKMFTMLSRSVEAAPAVEMTVAREPLPTWLVATIRT